VQRLAFIQKPPERNCAEVRLPFQKLAGPSSLLTLGCSGNLRFARSTLKIASGRFICQQTPLPYQGTLSPQGLCCTPDISVRFTSSPGHAHDLQALPYKTYRLYLQLQEVVVCSPGEWPAVEAPPRKVPGVCLGASAPQSLPRSSRDPPGWLAKTDVWKADSTICKIVK